MNELDLTKRAFITWASHELMTPLTSILGYLDLLLADESLYQGEKKDFLISVQKQGQHLEKIMNDLLLLSEAQLRLDIGLAREVQPVEKIIRNFFDSSKETQCFNVDVSLPKDLTEVWLDKDKILRVLEALLSNAVKFSSVGRSIRVIGSRSRENYLISIEDEGTGMPGDKLDVVFDPFHRLDSSDTARGGLGLGLAVAKTIVEAHGGRIFLNSSPGIGTKATFSLPLDFLNPNQPV